MATRNWKEGVVYGNAHLAIDAYRFFLALVFASLGLMTVAMAGVGLWLFRRNRHLPHLVKRGPRKYTPFER